MSTVVKIQPLPTVCQSILEILGFSRQHLRPKTVNFANSGFNEGGAIDSHSSVATIIFPHLLTTVHHMVQIFGCEIHRLLEYVIHLHLILHILVELLT